MDGSAVDVDHRVRLPAFDFLASQTQRYGEVLPRSALSIGLTFDGARVPLIGPQHQDSPGGRGPAPPYAEEVGDGGLMGCPNRGTDPVHRDNVCLRLAKPPRVYLCGVVLGQYLPVWPVDIMGDDPAQPSFRVAVDDLQRTLVAEEVAEPSVAARRKCITTVTQRHLHQESFRQWVLQAHQTQLALAE
ncbi:MAG TPA: hypothetical protein VLM91_19195 [Candidatus Methylomirabilis sp.]|nr:hypothetical protein [Candidatus Methylomirabilis sp.]